MDNSYDILSLNSSIQNDELAATSSRSYYSSALNPSFYTPVIRRRGSTSDNIRQYSNDEIVPPDTPVRARSGNHPLKGVGSSRGNGDAGVTRPHLSRIVNGTPVQMSSEESSPTWPPRQEVEERVVLVHEVMHTDSLAGVSLKYGISMADLRKANKLWTSDSIHLRRVLYIPIENAERAKEYILDSKLLSLTTSTEERDSTSNSSEASAGGTVESSSQTLAAASNMGTIRRIPATHLSFFPPPQSPPQTSKKIDQQERNPQYGSANGQARYATIPSQSLNSLLTALPISASTRDTIIARLSFDSTSSNDSRPSDLDDIFHERHELGDVSPRTLDGLDRFHAKTARALSPSRTPTAKHTTLSKAKALAPSYHPRTTSMPTSYIPTRSQIRTIQLEPTPVMELPSRAGSSRRGSIRVKSQPNLLEESAELRGTSTGI